MLFAPLCAHAQDVPGMASPPPEEMMPGGMHVASMKMGGATFWLRYTKTPDSMLAEAEKLEHTGDGSLGMSEVQAWLKLIRAADGGKKVGQRLGDVELTVEGDAKSGADAVKAAAESGSGEHMYMLALLYYHGIGLAQDYKQAYFWMLNAVQPNGMPNPWVMHFAEGDLKKISDKLTPKDMAAQTKRNREGSWGNVPGLVPGAVTDPPGGPPEGPGLPGGPPDMPGMGMPGGAPMGMENGLTMYPPPYLP
ncbi:MAG: sel1 repeat family protein [Alphaproteobacteria bacterium]|nr:MAG: sel1 repeat family protein [Alphaproteobacteria bacterium]